jgi:hypothetical protein
MAPPFPLQIVSARTVQFACVGMRDPPDSCAVLFQRQRGTKPGLALGFPGSSGGARNPLHEGCCREGRAHLAFVNEENERVAWAV